MDCIILTGIQHSGKTTAGKMTAERMGCNFYDIDEIIEKTAGISCRKIFAQQGADAFKQAEAEACLFLKNLLQTRRNGIENTSKAAIAGAGEITEGAENTGTHGILFKAVVAAGGGICDNPRALSVLETIGTFVYLQVSEAAAFERICARAQRTGSFPAYIEKQKPKNDGERRSIFHGVYMRRTAEYKKRAHVHINTEGLTPDEVSRAVFTALQKFDKS